MHLTAWTNEVAQRLLTGTPTDAFEDGDWPPVLETTDAAWKSTLHAHEQAHRTLVERLAGLSSSRLAERFGTKRDQAAGSGVTYTVMLHGLAQHDAYHMGQVALLKKAIRGAR